MSEKNTLVLSNPINAHDEEVTELLFREPNGGDIIAIGMPMTFVSKPGGGDTTVKVDGAAMGEYISRLAGIPLSSVKMLSAADTMGAVGLVMDFFGDTEAT